MTDSFRSIPSDNAAGPLRAVFPNASDDFLTLNEAYWQGKANTTCNCQEKPDSSGNLSNLSNSSQAPTIGKASQPAPMDRDKRPTGNSKAKRSRGGQTEADFQATMIGLLRTLGYEYVYHTHNSRFSEGGFLDILAIRIGDDLNYPLSRRFVVIELKRDKAKLRPARYTKKGRWIPGQQDWLNAFQAVGAEAYVWRTTDDLDQIAEVLR